MGRPIKKGLRFFYKDVDYYDDERIIDLLYEFGPIGQTIYDIVLCMVYRNGYYLEIGLDSLTRNVVKIIGNRWVKKDLVRKVILYCADIGLFNDALLQQSVITSASIQRSYQTVHARNKILKNKYWLLENE